MSKTSRLYEQIKQYLESCPMDGINYKTNSEHLLACLFNVHQDIELEHESQLQAKDTEIERKEENYALAIKAQCARTRKQDALIKNLLEVVDSFISHYDTRKITNGYHDLLAVKARAILNSEEVKQFKNQVEKDKV